MKPVYATITAFTILVSIVGGFIWFLIYQTTKDDKYYPCSVAAYTLIVPDSMKTKQQEWITSTVKAASFHLSAGDYEHVDRTINEVTEQSYKLFSVQVNGLIHIKVEYEPSELIPYEDLNPIEKHTFDSLKLTSGIKYSNHVNRCKE